MGNHCKLDRLDPKLWKLTRLSSIIRTDRESLISLLDYLLDVVLHTQGACGESRLPDKWCSGFWGHRWVSSIRNRVHGRIPWVTGVEMVSLLTILLSHTSDLASSKSSFRLLIIEGIPSVCLGIFGWFFLADSPESAWYLSPPQRQLVVSRRTLDQREASTPSAQVLNRGDVLAAFKDWKIWAFCLLNFPGDLQLFSYSIFLPTIIKAVNPDWSTLYVQALTVPCYAWSAIVYFTVAFISDAIQHRAVFGILGAMVSIVGHIMLIASKGVAVPFAGCFVIATGVFLVSGIALVWLPTNLPRYGKRSTGVGMLLMLGNSAGIAAPYVSHTLTSVLASKFLLVLSLNQGFSPALPH